MHHLFLQVSFRASASSFVLFFFLLGCWAEQSVAQHKPAYTIKARNLQPVDFGYEGKSWEAVLRHMNDKLDERPDDLSVLLERAIAYREYGVRRALVLRKRDWKRSKADFEKLLTSDSSFQDVLYQYSMLRRYQGDFDHALRLLHRQLEVTPSSAHAVVALFRLYHQFLDEEDGGIVEEWISANPSPFASFFKAELLRKRGQSRTADNLLVELLKKTEDTFSLQPVLLSRARIYYEMRQDKIAESFVVQAIDIIGNEIDARLVFEDFKYILNDEEIQVFLQIKHAEEHRAFFSGVLERRNPIRSAETNRRLAEHFRRLITSEKRYAFYESREAYRVGNNVRKDKMADNDFPFAYWLNGEFGDKGLIYIRHGVPYDKVASVTEGTPMLESWRYLSPDLDFHFEGHGKLAELIPTIPLEERVLEAHEIWGGIYTRLASTARRAGTNSKIGKRSETAMDFTTFENELFDQSLAYVSSGLTTDRHQWSKEMRHLTVPHFIASFQGSADTSDVEVYFSVPIGMVSEVLSDTRKIKIEVGLAVHDMAWNEVFSSRETLTVDAARAKDAVAVDYIRFAALPDSYHVNLHAQIVDTEWIGSYQFDYDVPAYHQPQLMISDLVPAFEVSPIDRPSRYAKKGLYLRSNPGRGFDPDDPFFIYFELYNLTYGSDDFTNFEITYTLQKPIKEGRRKRRRRAAAREPLLSITYERTGEASNLAEYGEIDMSAVPAGRYELVVTVKDTNTGAVVSNSREIELGE